MELRSKDQARQVATLDLNEFECSFFISKKAAIMNKWRSSILGLMGEYNGSNSERHK
ncbi:MAG: hypothetical protein PHY13_09575 [Clostridia bacterium]|jgi:hypothetical protein|nr:hypothetical protein [Clostridia bacterium]